MPFGFVTGGALVVSDSELVRLVLIGFYAVNMLRASARLLPLNPGATPREGYVVYTHQCLVVTTAVIPRMFCFPFRRQIFL